MSKGLEQYEAIKKLICELKIPMDAETYTKLMNRLVDILEI